MILIGAIVIGIYCVYWIIMDVYFFRERKMSAAENNDLPFVSIVICAHNEEQYVESCLHGILNQEGAEQHAEIIFVNDASDDHTLQIATRVLSSGKVPFKIIDNKKREGKKKCIEKAVKAARESSEYIVLRDADTFVNTKDWLKSLLKKMYGRDLLIAPVITSVNNNSVAEWFQYYEGLALMHLTNASLNASVPILCNGANMAFKKTKFMELNPYKDNYHIFSGDDIFLLRAFYLSKSVIVSSFSKESIVYTYSPSGIKELFNQKTRWLSKMNDVKIFFNTFSAFIIGLSNVVLLLEIFFSIKWFFLLFLIKMCVDFKVVYSVRKKLKTGMFSWYNFLIAEVWYIPYVCALILRYFL